MSKKVLIVEDDKDFGSILQMKFESEGFEVVLAEDGEQGVAMADSEKPDLIISDLLIPKLDGVQMSKKIREAGNSAPIIFLTNMKDEKYIKEVEGAGDDYLIKSDLPIGDIVKKAKEKLGI